MEILNVGPLELIFILLIAFIILGPEEAIKAGKKIGVLISRLMKSETWVSVVNASKEIRRIPKKLITESGAEETLKDLSMDLGKVSDELSTSLNTIKTPSTRHNGSEKSTDEGSQ
jgi:Sec-independent protein translocase protein TatA